MLKYFCRCMCSMFPVQEINGNLPVFIEYWWNIKMSAICDIMKRTPGFEKRQGLPGSQHLE